ncbi:NEAT domain-containing protein [Weissella confusa]|uniref:NEAT domain-containing protein n=1 Tax=Weissella confusa TaxID=1583 RepID=UPI0021C1AE34|nr:NEAT domain-containing protein [Weissella confusa]
MQDGVYKVPFTNYKTGTTTASSMNRSLKTPATITVNNGQANIDIETSNEMIMGMMSNYRFNDVKATAKGTHWLVTLPVNALSKTIATSMTISMNGRVIESPTADMLFDIKNATLTNNPSTVPEVPDSTTSDKLVPSQPATKPAKPSTDVTAVETDSTRSLSILQADKNDKSMAANYMLDTVKLTKNADGTYYAYLTTHTPAMMGQNPIRFNDAKHAAELMSTNLVNGYYQSVFRLTLSESELTTPISTHIHVQFTSPLVYDENYEIRLVIGDQLSSNASVNNQNELTDTVIVPRETATTATPFEPAPVTFTTVASSVPMAPTPLAVTHPISSPQTASTSELATSDKTIKLTPAKKQTVSKNKNDKSTSKPSQSDAPKHSTITRATMITAGVVITATVGFVGASLALNIFKHQ